MATTTFVGPTLLSGIGQMLHKYLGVFPGSTYFELVNPEVLPAPGDTVVVFALPVAHWIATLKKLKHRFKRVVCMTICETETVHEDYGLLFDECPSIVVASEFCKKVFERQFPGRVRCTVVPAHVPLPAPVTLEEPPKFAIPKDRYVFYHIGNIIDQRKNIQGILEAFLRLNKPQESFLVLKATCLRPIEIRLPNVLVINGLVPDTDLEQIHAACDCYVSFSSSEGIGMGAVEAALHSKPVIITEYGGAPEYIKTPYTIPCGLQEIPRDDFLFKKGMLWGRPDSSKLLEFMGHAFENKVRVVDHEFTRQKVSSESVSALFAGRAL